MIKPWLWIPPKIAHDLGPFALKGIAPLIGRKTPHWNSFDWQGLHFANRCGIAGGVDKNGQAIKEWWRLGVGFMEVGTVTPKPQKANPGQIIDRQSDQQAVWNKMGFPNNGMASLKRQLAKVGRPYQTPLFINIGKNRDTGNEEASSDYVKCLKYLSDEADAFVVNISSPNTKNLRELQQSEQLEQLLKELMNANTANRPLLLKISPDIDQQQIAEIIDVSCRQKISGWIISNTTRDRSPQLRLPSEGGVSGAPLKQKSRDLLARFMSELGDRRDGKLIVSVGGISTYDEIQTRLDLGADLVQAYAALIYEGPTFFLKMAKQAIKH